MITRNFLIILVGLPASGKTTIAETLKSMIERKQTNFTVEIVDTDQIRNIIAPDKFNPKKERLVRERSLNEVKMKLHRGFIVISDDLNYYTSMRHDLKAIADEKRVPYFILHINTPFKKCIEWNVVRGEPIPKEVIYKIQKKFDTFYNYNWDRPIYTVDPSNIDSLEKSLEKVLTLIESNLNITKGVLFKNKIKKKINFYREELDTITRNWVSDNIKDDMYRPFIKQILKLRKKFIKMNKNKIISESQIIKQFTEFIKRNIKFEST